MWHLVVQITESLLQAHELVVWPESIEALYQLPFEKQTAEAFFVDGVAFPKEIWRRRSAS